MNNTYFSEYIVNEKLNAFIIGPVCVELQFTRVCEYYYLNARIVDIQFLEIKPKQFKPSH